MEDFYLEHEWNFLFNARYAAKIERLDDFRTRPQFAYIQKETHFLGTEKRRFDNGRERR
jgi:hypothetical protein